MEFLLASLAGTFIGAVLGFIGAGGAMLAVPILIYVFDFQPAAATTAALAIVCAAAVSGAYPKARGKEILYKEALFIWGLGLLTNISASLIAHRLSPAAITTGTAIVLILAATSMFMQPIEKTHVRISNFNLLLLSLLIGCVTGFFGIGGGFIVLPVLVLGFGTPLAIATGTSLAVIAANSLTAFIGHFAVWNQVNWSLTFVVASGAVVVAGITSRIHSRINPLILRRSFAILLYLVATFTVFKTWVL